jgi:signal transduction histidine kinase
MTDQPQPNREQLQQELQFFRADYNRLGAERVRLEQNLGQVSREMRRSQIVAKLVRDAYAIGSLDLEEDGLGGPILAIIVAEVSFCDRALFFQQDPDQPGVFKVEHSRGAATAERLSIPEAPRFLFTSSAEPGGPEAQRLSEFAGVPFLLWAFNPASGRALLVGKRTESNIHRAFESNDREIVEVALAVYEDVLLRKRAEAALRQAKLAAEENNNARARFLAHFSHELRTPLNAIIGFAQLLMQQGKQTRPPEEAEEYARLILDAGESLSTLAKDILDFSYLSNGRPQLRIDWVPVDYLFHNAERAVSAQRAQFEVEIRIRRCVEGLQAAIDYDRFRQILSNLLANALKFTPSGGHIELSAHLAENRAIVLTVRDNGIGIKSEDLPRILEPFVQLNGSVNGFVHGVGLGLPIALQLVEAHGGRMQVQSVFGEGTAVVITLPPDSARLVAPSAYAGPSA